MARAARKEQARSTRLPPPVGGWNARDPLQSMPSPDAVILDNFIPDVKETRLRGGSLTHATGMPGPVESLMEYTAGAAGTVLLAASWDAQTNTAAIYDVSVAGPVDLPLLTGLANARFQHTMFATTGGQFLCMVNGQDGYYTFDGAALENRTAGVTGAGLDVTKVVSVTAHMNRLWFIPENASDVWYLDAQAIQGAATKLPLGPFLRRGGEILAMGSWTRDGGSGMDDYAVFVSSRGEVLIYQGTDPASASTWSYVGLFQIAEPIGRRCLVRAGGDLAVLTAQGLLPLSAVLDVNESGQSAVAFTDKIIDAYRNAYYAGQFAFGWQVAEFPSQNMVFANVPLVEREVSHQYVLNIRNGAWSRFKGLDAACWSRMGSRFFYGAMDGTVREYAPSLSDDDGQPITGTILQAFSDYKTPANKMFTMVRPRFRAPAGFAPRVTIRLDYDDAAPSVESVAITDAGPEWDAAFWDEAEWGAALLSSARWQSVVGIATAGTVGFSISATVPISYEGCDVVYKVGGVL